VVFSPFADVKEYPENVDLVLVEGAVANDENLEMIRKVRARTKTLVAFGDCAVTGNVTALRNPLGVALEVLRPVYLENGDLNAQIPDEKAIVPVDYFLPGCPPPAGHIRAVLAALLRGEQPVLEESQRKFG
jgi:NAD-reducing hydrogenase small subunit